MRIVKHNMTEELAIRLLGWKWVTIIGIPTKDHPQYPERIPVRQLLSPDQLKDPIWIGYLDRCDAQLSDGTEPLAYCNGSSSAPLPKITILVDE
jgi:hypothetical protein